MTGAPVLLCAPTDGNQARQAVLQLLSQAGVLSWPQMVSGMGACGYTAQQVATAVDDLEGVRSLTITGDGIRLRRKR